MLQHSWRGLAGLSPSAFCEGVRKLQPQEPCRGRGGGGRGGGVGTGRVGGGSHHGRGGDDERRGGGFKRVLNALRLDSLSEFSL